MAIAENLFEKDKDAKLDYTADWTAWLGADDISIATWVVPTGITKVSDSNNTKIAVIWLEGGTIGVIYEVICRIATTAGRIDDRTLLFKIVEK